MRAERREKGPRRTKDERIIEGGAAFICHSADGMSGENREIGPSRSCSNSRRGSRSEKLSAFANRPLPLTASLILSLVAKVGLPFFLSWCVRLSRIFILNGLNDTSFHFFPL